jgi:hypothetical protein
MLVRFFGGMGVLVGSPVSVRAWSSVWATSDNTCTAAQWTMGVIDIQITGPELAWPQEEGYGNKYKGMLSVSRFMNWC